jgi:hypothetical protein
MPGAVILGRAGEAGSVMVVTVIGTVRVTGIGDIKADAAEDTETLRQLLYVSATFPI